MKKEKYIFDDEKDFEIFMNVEKHLDKNTFPIMSKIGREEIGFINRKIKKEDRILEIGCGGGRVLRKIKSQKKNLFGIDINKKFINYCKSLGFNIFYLNVFKEVPDKHKNKYDVLFLTYNLFYNFSEEERLKTINQSKNLLKKSGKLILTVFSNNKISDKDKRQMQKYYETVINAPKKFKIRFINKNNERGFAMTNEGKIFWFSQWKTKEEIIKEAKNWKGMALKEINLMKNQRAYNVVLKKIIL